MKITVALTSAALTAALAGCGSAHPAARPSATWSPPTLTLLQACKLLRANMIANGGTADKPTLERVYNQASGQIMIDAGNAIGDVGNGNLWWIDAANFARDCRPAGVQIPG